MRASACVLLEAGRETRIALLSDEYRHFFADPSVLYTQLDCLVSLHGAKVIADWKAQAARGEWDSLVASLLEDHYDPAYRRSALRNFVRLPEAQRMRLDSAADESFARVASEILAAPKQLEAA
jgi:tRNA 2-selenouridine synthase